MKRLCSHILRLVPAFALTLVLATAGQAHRMAQPVSPEIGAISAIYGDGGWLCGEGTREGRAECAACLPAGCGLPAAAPALPLPPGVGSAITSAPGAAAPVPPRRAGQAEARAPPVDGHPI